MTQYECYYSSGRQFVFTERRRGVVTGLLAFATCGLALGLAVSAAISLAGVVTFELMMLLVAGISALQAYNFTFQRKSSSVDVSSYMVAIPVFAAILGVMLCAVRYSLALGLGPTDRCALFGAVGLTSGLLVNGYMRLCCIEDARKHYLGVCDSDGGPADDPVFAQRLLEASDSGEDVNDMSPLEQTLWFAWWVLSAQCWFDLRDWPSDEEHSGGDSFVVFNHTLKLIKVCFYSPDDVFCWIPYGGVAGPGVGMILPQESRTFVLHRRPGKRSGRHTLKVFQPGLFDKELAVLRVHHTAGSYAFYDVEGMVQRSRLLSSSPATTGSTRSGSYNSMVESSEAEDEPSTPTWPRPRLNSAESPKSPSGGSGLMRRPTCGDLLQRHQGSKEDLRGSPSSNGGESGRTSLTPRSPQRGGSLRSESRRAGVHEVVVRNRSNQEICASLFRSNDYCYLVPLCSDCILPDAECRFDRSGCTDRDFTLKVYSTGPGAKELTYLMVSRGSTYTFSDSLLS